MHICGKNAGRWLGDRLAWGDESQGKTLSF